MAELPLERVLLKQTLSLPTPVLRALSGGAVIYRGGRTLDPRFQFLSTHLSAPEPGLASTPDTLRLRWSKMSASVTRGDLPGIQKDPVSIGTLDGLCHRPKVLNPDAPLVLLFHDGGGVLGNPSLSAPFAARLADEMRTVVLTPSYRLAPEDRFPAALEDAEIALDYAFAEADRLGAKGVVLAGQSIGAALAAVLALHHRGDAGLKGQILVHPLLSPKCDGPCASLYADAWPVSTELVRFMLAHYVGAEADANDPDLNPLMATDLEGLAPAVIISAGFDPVGDQGELYAKKLLAAGQAVAYRRMDNLPHSFPLFADVVPDADLACRLAARLLRPLLS